MSPSSDASLMRRALELAVGGQGAVEPNPMVGCVIARAGQIIGEGWHERFGGPHAEASALQSAGVRARGANLYVTLEPCCHHGKTPPCTQAIIASGIRRAVIALADPFEKVAGRGIEELRAAGIDVQLGLMEKEARDLTAPYLKLVTTGRPWIIAKWAMTLDGKIAARTGDSRWISGHVSREIVHKLRGRVDAVIVGRGTAAVDDPLLTARPPGPRVAVRIVVDSHASLSPDSRLVRTARETPVIVAAGTAAPREARERLSAAGCEVLICQGSTHEARLESLTAELGRRAMTNVLVEGGGQLLGGLLDTDQIDEVHGFIAPLLLGGKDATAPIAGAGISTISQALRLDQPTIETLGTDVYVHGRVVRNPPKP